MYLPEPGASVPLAILGPYHFPYQELRITTIQRVRTKFPTVPITTNIRKQATKIVTHSTNMEKHHCAPGMETQCYTEATGPQASRDDGHSSKNHKNKFQMLTVTNVRRQKSYHKDSQKMERQSWKEGWELQPMGGPRSRA